MIKGAGVSNTNRGRRVPWPCGPKKPRTTPNTPQTHPPKSHFPWNWCYGPQAISVAPDIPALNSLPKTISELWDKANTETKKHNTEAGEHNTKKREYLKSLFTEFRSVIDPTLKETRLTDYWTTIKDRYQADNNSEKEATLICQHLFLFFIQLLSRGNEYYALIKDIDKFCKDNKACNIQTTHSPSKWPKSDANESLISLLDEYLSKLEASSNPRYAKAQIEQSKEAILEPIISIIARTNKDSLERNSLHKNQL